MADEHVFLTVRDMGKGALRPGVEVELLLLGGSIAHGQFHKATLTGVVYAHEITGQLYVGPHQIAWWDRVRIIDALTVALEAGEDRG